MKSTKTAKFIVLEQFPLYSIYIYILYSAGNSTNIDAKDSLQFTMLECNTINLRIVITTDIDSDGKDSDDIEGFNSPSNSRYPIATPQEKYLWRLLKGKNHN